LPFTIHIDEAIMQRHDEREQFLKQPHVAILATIGPGNRPHAMPIWYLYENGDFIILTGDGSQKHRNVERHPQVTLAIDRRDLPYYAVMIQGTATLGPPPSDALRLRLATRYLGEEGGAAYTARRRGTKSVTIRVHPDKFVEYRGNAGSEAPAHRPPERASD
jgi:PPOX class probable F420-dependent enzyme